MNRMTAVNTSFDWQKMQNCNCATDEQLYLGAFTWKMIHLAADRMQTTINFYVFVEVASILLSYKSLKNVLMHIIAIINAYRYNFRTVAQSVIANDCFI